MMSSKYLLFLYLLTVHLIGCVLCQSPPVFFCNVVIPGGGCVDYQHMGGNAFPENVQLNDVIYTLKAIDPEGGDIIYKIIKTSDGNIVPGSADGIDYLQVEPTSGNVTYYKQPDHEEYTEVRPTWNITSTVSGLSTTQYVRVFVTNVNDIDPEFINEPYISDPLPENTTIGSVVFNKVDSTDADADDEQVDGPNVYFIVPTWQNYDCEMDTFRIDKDTGEVILDGLLEYAEQTQYTVCIQVDDQGSVGDPRQSTTNIRLSVTDVQGSPPYFEGIPYSFSVAEDAALNMTVFENINAFDGDRGLSDPNDVIIELQSGGDGKFRIESFINTANVLVADELDREFQDSYTLVIQALETDTNQEIGDIFTNTTIEVTILDVNDEMPVFLGNQTTVIDLQENSPAKTPLNLGIQVEDKDTAINARFTLSLQGDEGAFELYETDITGIGSVDIRVKDSGMLDYENRTGFEFQVIASEEGHADTSIDVIVNLIDINDNSPEFERDNYNCTVEENSEEGTPICQVTATDIDSEDFATIKYYVEGSGKEKFNIDINNGIITVAADAELDIDEGQTVFFLTVLADDNDRIDTTLLEIQLLDLNDVAPEFNLGPTERQITINEFNNLTYIQEPLVMVSASDGDFDEINRDLRYSIYTGNEKEKFSIDANTGEITLIDTIDYEEDPIEYNLMVLANNTAAPYLTGSDTIQVFISDINDNNPVFESSNYTVNVSEAAEPGFEVINVIATDKDGQPGDPNSRIDYRIMSGSQDQFRIVVDTGVILVNDDLNREATSEYTLEVQAADRGIDQRTGTCTVWVTIVDVNDVAPVFDPVEPWSIGEDIEIGASNVFYNATAEDPDVSKDLRYSIDVDNIIVEDEDGEIISDGRFSDQFGIVETTGGLYANKILDREDAAMFILPLIVEDFNGVEEQKDETIITITILDVNDNSPSFKDPPYIFDVEEHEPAGTVISTAISATDPDLGVNGDVWYSKLGGSGVEYVEIDEETGVLSAFGDEFEFNREEHASLEVTIQASDKGETPNTANITVILNISDINDNPPVFNTTIPARIPIYEDVEIGTWVLKVTATDRDTPENSQIVYTISAGNNEGKFEVNSTSGVITTNGTLDRETEISYTLTVSASDGGPPDDIEVNVDIVDVNDMIPMITSPEFDNIQLLSETDEEGTTLFFVTGEDGDQPNTPNSILGFYVGGGNSTVEENSYLDTNLFAIDNITGEITIASSLQTLSNVYTLVVIVQDQGEPPLESNRTLIIDVMDVNDDTPRIYFPEVDDVIYIPEGHRGEVLFIDARDSDPEENGIITYEFDIVQGGNEDYKKFFLDSKTGNLTLNETADRELQAVYILNIRAANRDSAEQRVSETVPFTVEVNDTNDNEPIFREPDDPLPPPQPLDVGENMEIGTVVGKVDSANDKDDGPGNGDIFYFIVAGNDGGWFSLNKYDGIITLLIVLDTENQSEYPLIIKASSDENYTPPSSPITMRHHIGGLADFDPIIDPSLLEVVISVTDENDNEPIFDQEFFTGGVLDTIQAEEPTGIVLTATDQDPDPANSRMEFYLIAEQNCQIDKGCNDQVQRTFDVLPDGAIYTTRIFEDRESGWFELDVGVRDPTKDEYMDTSRVDIYLITDRVQVRIDFSVPTGEVQAFEDEFLELYATIIEEDDAYDNVAINRDQLYVYSDIETGFTIANWTRMLAHAVNLDDNRIIDALSVRTAIDEAYDYQDILKNKYSVIEVERLFIPEEPFDFTWLQWMFLGIAIGLLFVLILVLLAFVFTRNDYKRKLRAANAGLFTTNAKPVNPTIVPGTNLFAAEASNPVFDEKKSQYEEMDNDTSTEEGESANSMSGSEAQEFTLDMYNDENDRPTDGGDNSSKLLLAVLEELDIGKPEKYGLDNIDVTDV